MYFVATSVIHRVYAQCVCACAQMRRLQIAGDTETDQNQNGSRRQKLFRRTRTAPVCAPAAAVLLSIPSNLLRPVSCRPREYFRRPTRSRNHVRVRTTYCKGVLVRRTAKGYLDRRTAPLLYTLVSHITTTERRNRFVTAAAWRESNAWYCTRATLYCSLLTNQSPTPPTRRRVLW